MEKTLKYIAFVIISAVILTGSSFFYANDFYNTLVVEDGIIENITAITLLLISILFLYRLIKTRGTKSTPWLIFNTLIIFGSFFGFGEEISWGQRIFSIESGEFFSEYNLQNETNLHNLKINGIKINKLIFSYGFVLLFGFYLLLSPFTYKKNQWFKNQADRFGVPIPKLNHTGLSIILTTLIMLVPDQKKWELWESIFVLIMLLIFLNPLNTNEKLIPAKDKLDS